MSVILHVEDNPGHALLVKKAIHKLAGDCDIMHVADGEAALKYLYRRNGFLDPQTSPRPELVLLDLNLPKLHGQEVLKKIKENADLCNIPVVVLTTSSSEKDKFTCFENHADDYLTKPGSYTDLVEILRTALERWQVSTRH